MKCTNLFSMTECSSGINDEKLAGSVSPVLSWRKENRNDLSFGSFGRLIAP